MTPPRRDAERSDPSVGKGIRLAIMVAAVGLIAFAVGYLTGDEGETPLPAPTVDKRGNPATPALPLDSTAILEETGVADKPTPPPEFSFTKTLSEERPPAMEAVATAPEAPVLTATPTVAPTVAPTPAPAKPVAASTPRPTPKPTPRPTSPPKDDAEAPDGSYFTVQVAAFSDAREAAAFRERLSKKGYNAFSVPFRKGDANWYRVRVGLFRTKGAALREAEKLKQSERVSPMIVIEKR